MKSRFAINNEIIDSDDGFVRFHFSAHTKGALLYIASCYVVRTTIKAKLHLQLGFNCFTNTAPKAPLIIYAKEPGLQAVNHTRRAPTPSKAANAEMRC